MKRTRPSLPPRRRVAYLLQRGFVVGVSVAVVRMGQLLWQGQPKLGDEWPYAAGSLVVAAIGVVVCGRLAAPEESGAAAPVAAPEPSVEGARALARGGRRIQAIQMLRRATGMPLEEAVEQVKRMETEP